MILDLLLANKNEEKGKNSRDNKNFAKPIKINTIQETAKIYSDYDRYSESLQSLINNLGSKPTQKNEKEEKEINKAKQEVKNNLRSLVTKTTPENDEELLRKKRELLMTPSDKRSSSKKGKDSEKKKKTINMPKNKIKIHMPLEEEKLSVDDKEADKEPEINNLSEKDLIKKKQKIIQESLKNRQIAESKKNVVMNDKLKEELEEI